MAIELITRRLCDACAKEGRTTVDNVHSVGASFEGAEDLWSRTAGAVELCREHVDAISLTEFVALMVDEGRPLGGSDTHDRKPLKIRRTPRDRTAAPRGPQGQTPHHLPPFYCLVCWRSFGNNDTRKRHYRDEHGLSWAPSDIEFICDPLCPLCDRYAPLNRGIDWARHLNVAHECNTSTALYRAAHGDSTRENWRIRTLDELRAAEPGVYAR